jgi:hypothetical protein
MTAREVGTGRPGARIDRCYSRPAYAIPMPSNLIIFVLTCRHGFGNTLEW